MTQFHNQNLIEHPDLFDQILKVYMLNSLQYCIEFQQKPDPCIWCQMYYKYLYL